MTFTQQRVPKRGQARRRSCRSCAGAALVLAILIGCAALARGQSPAPAASPEAPPVASPVTPPVAEPVARPQSPQPSVNYRLKPKDVVRVTVYEEGDLDTTGRVDSEGNIFFPLVGQATIGGQTVQEATATIVSLLHKYLVHPQVSMEIITYAKEHFTMLGQINKPGIFDFPDEGNLNLLEAIGMAGGYTKIANASKIIIKRYVNGSETIIRVDGKKLLNPHYASAPVFQVEPGDTINVGEAMF